ncbi:globin domain-containing protein [Pseudonocardia asaccharolytica]|uniref:nitric oxide dioxygenase n=1 Tax=Pseudonocardia asaccharolytica DSM 44247 = NBRC 16224 TaxID=1123024 RepID=A0A511D197_9PSEU|nr:globin domain-containing protein [Pseudonocardia asaccharolytica]GEL18303.1 flavohemoprotein [Pseudonocardia asaccharolytica DSM 44247 = NBRC 16224]
MAAVVRESWALVEPRAHELATTFYRLLFEHAPQARTLFPVDLPPHRSRLLPALVHVLQRVDRPRELSPILAQLGRDHRKFGIAATHYETVGVALLGAVEQLLGAAWTAEVADAWAAAYSVVSARMLAGAAAGNGPASWLGRVVDHHRLSWDLAVISVQALEPIPYRAGQYLSIETPHRPRLWRYLSPANPPRPDGLLQFHVRAVAGGLVSPALVAHTRVDDVWRLGPPMGGLPLDAESRRDLLLVAGGTGAAPIKAIVTQLAVQGGPRRTHVFVGGRTWIDLYAVPSLTALAHRSPWLDVVPAVEHNAGEAEHGAVGDVVGRHGPWTDHDVIVAGSPDMIRATVARLVTAGTPPDRIRHDPLLTDRAA